MMAKHKVSELTGALLDAAVAKAEGERAIVERTVISIHHADGAPDRVLVDEDRCHRLHRSYDGTEKSGFWLAYSLKWELGGPIIERDRISIYWQDGVWVAGYGMEAREGQWYSEDTGGDPAVIEFTGAAGSGPKPLIAAMRARVASKFGEEVDLP